MADNPTYNSSIEIDPNQASSFTELTGTIDSNVELLVEQIGTSEFGDDGERRMAGRGDFTLDVTFKFDFAQAEHDDLLDALKDRELVDVRVFPDRDETGKYFAATCRIASFSLSLGNSDVVQVSASLQNADGDIWTFTNS